jgi:ferredoxin--NADP+ reductase
MILAAENTMHEITHKEVITPDVFLMKIMAPVIARKRKAGQFIIYRLHEKGERIPLTIADADPDEGTITLVFQAVGKSTMELGTKNAGDKILDIVGPLGKPTHVENFGTVVCIGGGIGVAPLYPIVEAMKDAGNNVVTIIGARTKDLLILEDMVRATSSDLHICTDDGSYCEQGFVTDRLKHLVQHGIKPDLCVAIGPGNRGRRYKVRLRRRTRVRRARSRFRRINKTPGRVPRRRKNGPRKMDLRMREMNYEL